MKTEVLFEIRKIRFRCSVDWNRIDACNFFLSSSPDQLRCCSCSAVGDWLEQKCLCDAFITFTFSKWFYHCLEKKAKKIILCCSLSQNLFFSALFVKDQNFSFCDAFIILLSQNVFIAVWERKKSFFFLIMTFHLWFWKKMFWRRKYISFHKVTFIFTLKKSNAFVFLNKNYIWESELSFSPMHLSLSISQNVFFSV